MHLIFSVVPTTPCRSSPMPAEAIDPRSSSNFSPNFHIHLCPSCELQHLLQTSYVSRRYFFSSHLLKAPLISCNPSHSIEMHRQHLLTLESKISLAGVLTVNLISYLSLVLDREFTPFDDHPLCRGPTYELVLRGPITFGDLSSLFIGLDHLPSDVVADSFISRNTNLTGLVLEPDYVFSAKDVLHSRLVTLSYAYQYDSLLSGSFFIFGRGGTSHHFASTSQVTPFFFDVIRFPIKPLKPTSVSPSQRAILRSFNHMPESLHSLLERYLTSSPREGKTMIRIKDSQYLNAAYSSRCPEQLIDRLGHYIGKKVFVTSIACLQNLKAIFNTVHSHTFYNSELYNRSSNDWRVLCEVCMGFLLDIAETLSDSNLKRDKGMRETIQLAIRSVYQYGWQSESGARMKGFEVCPPEPYSRAMLVHRDARGEFLAEVGIVPKTLASVMRTELRNEDLIDNYLDSAQNDDIMNTRIHVHVSRLKEFISAATQHFDTRQLDSDQWTHWINAIERTISNPFLELISKMIPVYDGGEASFGSCGDLLAETFGEPWSSIARLTLEEGAVNYEKSSKLALDRNTQVMLSQQLV